jgi:septal ring factor EnvC (AmiA/AmiB activator)
MNATDLAELATGTATTQAGIALIAAALAVAGALVAGLLACTASRASRRHATDLAMATARLAATEELLAGTRAALAQLQARLDQSLARHETPGTAAFRQAIALSKHGATTRQLIDICGLSQGEAQLIQTLYGREAPAGAADLH